MELGRAALAATVLAATMASVAHGQQGEPPLDGPTDSGAWVTALCGDGSRLYAAGSFSHVGRWAGGAALLDPDTGATTELPGAFDGKVTGATADGAGGLYVWGNFRNVGGYSREGIARIGADGRADGLFDPEGVSAEENVPFRESVPRAMQLGAGGAWLYVSGPFGEAGAMELLRLNPVTGERDPAWAPEFGGGAVEGLALGAGGWLYARGTFEEVDGSPRNGIARFDSLTGALDAWAPELKQGSSSASVLSIAAAGPWIAVAGDLDHVDGEPRRGIALFDAATGALLPAIAVPSGIAWGLVPSPDGSRLYAAMPDPAGDLGFPHIVVAISPSESRLVGTWLRTDGTSSTYTPLAWHDGRLFMLDGGFLRTVTLASDALAFDPTWSGPRTVRWSANLTRLGDGFLLGGDAVVVGEAPHEGSFLALDPATGRRLPFQGPDAEGVYRMATNDSRTRLFFEGGFEAVGGEPRAGIAALRTEDGSLTPWAPEGYRYGSSFRGMVPMDHAVLMGGGISGQDAPPALAFVDEEKGDVVQVLRASGTGSSVLQLAAAFREGTSLYIFGNISLDSGARLHAAALSAETGALLPWNPAPSAPVYSASRSGDRVYIAGAFTQVGGVPRLRLAEVSLADGSLTEWAPQANSLVTQVIADGPYVHAYGDFQQINGEDFRVFGTLRASDGGSTGFWDFFGETPNSLAIGGGTLFLGIAPPDGGRALRARKPVLATVTFQTDGTPGATLSGPVSQSMHWQTVGVPVEAVPPPGFAFVGWERDGEPYARRNPLVIVSPREDLALTARFRSTRTGMMVR